MRDKRNRHIRKWIRNLSKIRPELGNFSLCPFASTANFLILEKNLDEMISLSESVGKYFNFIRIDMYTNDNEIFLGEITNIHGGATEKFLPNGYLSEKQFSKILFDEN